MKVDVYSTMRNEIHIIQYFLRHYEVFADRIFVWDDGSNDGTREILQSHPKVKLLSVNLGRVDDSYFVKYLWPQYRDISRGHADWVICVDADEFIYHPEISQKLTELKSNGINKVCCEGFTMYHDTFPITSGQIYDEVRVGVKDKWSTKTVLFDPKIEIHWTEGRHRCSRKPEGAYNTGIRILHFRYLGLDYYIERTRKNLSYTETEFNMDRKMPMPDGTRDIPYQWYKTHKDKFEKVVE